MFISVFADRKAFLLSLSADLELPSRVQHSGNAGEGQEDIDGAEQDAADRAQLPGHHQAWRVQDRHHAGGYCCTACTALAVLQVAVTPPPPRGVCALIPEGRAPEPYVTPPFKSSVYSSYHTLGTRASSVPHEQITMFRLLFLSRPPFGGEGALRPIPALPCPIRSLLIGNDAKVTVTLAQCLAPYIFPVFL